MTTRYQLILEINNSLLDQQQFFVEGWVGMWDYIVYQQLWEDGPYSMHTMAFQLSDYILGKNVNYIKPKMIQ